MSGATIQGDASGSSVHLRSIVGGESYALAVAQVIEVAEFGGVTPVPGAPPHVLGVLNLRGNLTPVASLALLLGLTHPATEGPTREISATRASERLIVTESAGTRLALAVDDVLDVAEITGPFEPTDLPLLSGTVLVEGTLVGVIDIAAVFEAAGEGR